MSRPRKQPGRPSDMRAERDALADALREARHWLKETRAWYPSLMESIDAALASVSADRAGDTTTGEPCPECDGAGSVSWNPSRTGGEGWYREAVSSLPARVDLNAYHGDSWAQTFRFLHGTTPVDLTAATVESEARNGTDARTPLVVEITDAADGKITLKLPAALAHGRYSYDIEVTDGAVVTTWIRGSLVVDRDVTNET